MRRLTKGKQRLEKKFIRRPITKGDQNRILRNRLSKITTKTKRKYFSGKKVQAISRLKLIWKILHDTLGRKSKSTDVEKLKYENSNSEIISGNKNFTQKIKN